METAVNYILESSVSLGFLVLLYRAWFKHNPILWFNRLYLLLALAVSATIPLIHYTWGNPVATTQNLPEVQIGTGYYLLDAVTLWGSEAQTTFIDKLQQLPWLKLIYLTGILFLAAKLLIGLFRIRWHKQKGISFTNSGYVLVDTQNQLGPFSFFNILFINKNLYKKDEIKVIIEHELAHIKLKHTYDILLLELILIAQWFNPFAWLLRHDLKEIHEFQADQHTLQAGTNPSTYRELLVLQALGVRIDLGHNFSKSLTKKRLKMINSKNIKSLGFLKPIAGLLTIGLLIMAFGIEKSTTAPPLPIQNEVLSNVLQDDKSAQNSLDSLIPPPPPVSNVTPPPPAREQASVPPPPPPYVPDTTIYVTTEKMPEFNGGMPALMSFLRSNIKYPKEAQENGITGKVLVKFIVNTEGKVVKPTIQKGVNPLLDQEALRVVSSMPNWIPGSQDGENKNVSYVLPINFALSKPKVDQMPEYPGGRDKLIEYLIQNTKYPEEAKKNKVTGNAYVRFVVNETGQIDSVKIARTSGNELLDNEALRVIKSMPNWQPGKLEGKAVPVSYTLPIQFKLDQNKNAQPTTNTNEIIIDKLDVNKSQEKTIISGILLNPDKTPLKDATIVADATTRKTTSDANGSFSIEVIPSDQKLIISHINLKTKEIPIAILK